MASGRVFRLGWFILALSQGTVLVAADPASQPASTLELLAPPSEVLHLFEGDDPEKHIEGFANWHAWRSTLTGRKRRAANRFIARDDWLNVLAHEVVYDFESEARRLTAYKLLRRIGGQQVFPYFLWGMGSEADQVRSRGFGVPIQLVHQPSYVRFFFKRYGDPTVIEFLPDASDWFPVISRIERRWTGKEPPKRAWEPLQVERFEADLRDPTPSRRRLAIRALTTNGRYGGIVKENQYRKLMSDEDESVRIVAARSLIAAPCPEARGLLKRIVENEAASIELRRLALEAVVRCGKARRWTAEWMIAGMADWPPELDSKILASLILLQPPFPWEQQRYIRFLQQQLKWVQEDRARGVIEAALEALAP
ncbi:MAG: HEAT repeat domain-containing protein [Phycisphaerales bacterium]|nr:HEAT repeat domain-containing protein [Phycisphaerales bacterium]